jgi:group I intron endonuclease
MDYYIYKICCKNINIKDCYVGSTKNINKRIIQHSSSSNNENQKNSVCNVYKFINENGKWDNWEVTIVETIKCETKEDALVRERYWIETLKANLNSRSSYKRFKNNDERCKEWRLNNGDVNCICNSVVSRSNLARHLKTKKHLDNI